MVTAAADTDCKGKKIVEGETKKGFRFTYFYRYFFFINVTGVEMLTIQRIEFAEI